MSMKLPVEMDSLKVPPKIQKMDSPSSPLRDSMDDSGGGLGYQNTLVSKAR